MSAARELLQEADQQVAELVPEHNDHYDDDGQGQDARSTTAGPVAATIRSLGLFGLLLAPAVLAHHGDSPLGLLVLQTWTVYARGPAMSTYVMCMVFVKNK